MKNKKLFLVMAITMICGKTFGQNLSAGLDLGVFSSGSVNYTGFSLNGRYSLNDNVKVGVTYGYYSKTETIGSTSSSVAYSPFAVTFDYKFNDNDFSPYAGIDVGIYGLSVSVGSISLSTNNLGFAPKFGATYKLSDNLDLNTNVKYHYITAEGGSGSATSFNVGAIFNF